MSRDPLTLSIINALEHQFEVRKALTGESHYQACVSAGVNRKWFDDLKKPGKTARTDKLNKVLSYLGLTLPDLLKGENPSTHPVPLISWVQAGDMTPAETPYPPGLGSSTEHIAWPHPFVFALQVRGQSMNRIADEGDIVFVDYRDREPLNGKYYIFRDTADNDATFKRWRTNPDRMEPVTFEDHFSPIFPKETTEVVGRVIQVRKKL